MQALREPFTIRLSDVRSALGIAAPTMSEFMQRLGISYATGPDGGPKQGVARYLSGPEVRRVLEGRGFAFPTKAQVIAFIMCKGGVGKTTSTFFLSQRLSAYGARVLAIDADSQGNLTSAFGLEQYGIEVDAETPILVDLLTEACGIDDAIVAVTPTMHLLPSTPMNATLESKIRDIFRNPSLAVQKHLQPVLDRYDYILIDCAPALNLTNTAIVSAADMAVLPVAPDKFSQLGLEQTLNEVSQIELDFGLSIKKRIVFTKYDAREFTSLKYLAEIATAHHDKRFSTAVRTCADVKNVITRKDDLFQLRKSNAKEDYDAFARELMGLDKLFGADRRTRTVESAA